MEIREYPLISVIIPAYNAGDTIRRACSSVLAQEYPKVELIVVNDGSLDDTEEILRELESRYANLHCITQKNGGVSKARNTGLTYAQGSYIAFLDADDEMMPQCLSKLYTAIVDQDCDVAAGNYITVEEDGVETAKAYDFSREIHPWRDRDALIQSLKDHPATYAVWGKLYRREMIGDVRFVEGRRIHEDSFFLFALFLRNPSMTVVDEIVTRHHAVRGSASRTAFSEKFLDILYFAKEKYRIVGESFPEYLFLAENILVKSSLALLNVMKTNTDPQYKEVERECLSTVRTYGRSFIPAIPRDRVLFAIVSLRLYGVYKMAFRIYSKIR